MKVHERKSRELTFRELIQEGLVNEELCVEWQERTKGVNPTRDTMNAYNRNRRIHRYGFICLILCLLLSATIYLEWSLGFSQTWTGKDPSLALILISSQLLFFSVIGAFCCFLYKITPNEEVEKLGKAYQYVHYKVCGAGVRCSDDYVLCADPEDLRGHINDHLVQLAMEGNSQLLRQKSEPEVADPVMIEYGQMDRKYLIPELITALNVLEPFRPLGFLRDGGYEAYLPKEAPTQ